MSSLRQPIGNYLYAPSMNGWKRPFIEGASVLPIPDNVLRINKLNWQHWHIRYGQLVADLEQRGYIERVPNPNDSIV